MIYILNQISAGYETPGVTNGSRGLGWSGTSAEQITTPLTYEYINTNYDTLTVQDPYDDTYYNTNNGTIADVGVLNAYDMLHTDGYVYLAARTLSKNESSTIGGGFYEMTPSGSLGGNSLWTEWTEEDSTAAYSDGDLDTEYKNCVCPVVSVPIDVTYSGTGTEADPYVVGAINWTWDTTGQTSKSITVSTNGVITIDWGDGSAPTTVDSQVTDYTITHDYSTVAEGNYTVTIAENLVRKIICENAQVSSIDVRSATVLQHLSCGYNELTELNVTNNPALLHLSFSENQITEIDLSNNPLLSYFSCIHNQLTELDLTNNTALTKVHCYSNQLTSLKIDTCTLVTRLNCERNQLTSLNLNNLTALTYLKCGDNQLVTLDLTNNPLLTKVCATQESLNVILLNENLLTLTVVNETAGCESGITGTNVIHKCSNTCFSSLGHNGGTHQNNGVCISCGTGYQTHSQTTEITNYTPTSTQHTPNYACSYSDCTSTYPGTAENHSGATHANGGTCTICDHVYITHSKSGIIVSYVPEETTHTIVYACSLSGCTSTYAGEKEAHTRTTSCDKCGWTNGSIGYYLRLDNGNVRTIVTVMAGELVDLGYADYSAATYIVNSGTVTLQTVGNRRQFIMPAENVSITIGPN